MCNGGGGDSGADQMRADEAERERKMAEATAAINVMFGVRPQGVEDPNAAARAGYQQKLDMLRRLREQGVEQEHRIFEPYRPGDEPLVLDNEEALAYYQNKLAQLPAAPNNAAQAATARDNRIARNTLYRDTRGDILDYFTDQLGEQRERAESAIDIDMARRGLTYGSAATDADRVLQEENDQQLMNLTTRADSAVTDMRLSDEQARLDLIARIRAGMDAQSAIAGARSAMDNNINRTREQLTSTALEGLFSEVEDLYGQRRAVDAYNRGYQDIAGVATPGSSGTVSNGRVY